MADSSESQAPIQAKISSSVRSTYRARLFRLLKVNAITAVVVVVGYALIVSGLSIVIGGYIPGKHPLLIGGVVFLLVILLNPLRERLLKSIIQDIDSDSTANVTQEIYQEYSKKLLPSLHQSETLEILCNYITKNYNPRTVHIFILDQVTDQYKSITTSDKLQSTEILFSKDNPIIRILAKRRGAIRCGSTDSIPSGVKNQRSRLALLGTEILIPMAGKYSLIGLVSLGRSSSHNKYTDNNLKFLESLCEDAALAIERGVILDDLERRGQEIEILSRLSQGVNITLNFDDILELIFTQTSHAIPLDNFRITLTKNDHSYLQHVFIVEQGERIKEKENVKLNSNSCLEHIVIQSQRSLITEKYEHECRMYDVSPESEDIFCWVGVPLNAGSRTIGVISLSNHNPSLLYSMHHLNMLKAIADIAAAAIIKSRLLADSERKAWQLGSLNEITKSLTSTLELKPLLNQIMVSATNILNCEAGSLLTVEENSGELIFEVTIGPVADDLIGKRLPAGTGVVGKVVEQGVPVIINDAQRSQYWYSETDKNTGFITRDLLVVPMQVKQKTIGVIEVINKYDGAPFDEEDQNLLTTFTNQASIAIENARLYTQTDEALRSRIEEMSTMQRIVRELNSNLDYHQSMQITLKWSLRQSNSDAALIGTLEETKDDTYILMQTISDYAPEIEPPEKLADGINNEKESFSLTLPLLKKSFSDGNPLVVNLSKKMIDHSGVLLAGAQSQLIVPINRKSEIIAFLILESRKLDAYPEEIIKFLDQLGNHTAIALSNALLYKDLQAANLAKSDFISLVSHELRTPMTSIKGYTDLLAQGNAGAINDIQANFLSTIRTNVDRMSTLVSDLADISRIEAGKFRLEFSAIPVHQFIDEVVKSFRTQINNKNQSLKWEIPSNLPAIWGDHQRIVQILSNLVSNAHKYTPYGGQICIKARKELNRDNPDTKSEVVHIDVIDNGIGISSADQEQIFQKFFRGDTQVVQETPGTGLGLNITRHLVEMQGGNIFFTSEIGKGTVFSFTIPIYSSITHPK